MKDAFTQANTEPADVPAPRGKKTSPLWSCERHQQLRFTDAVDAAASVGEHATPRRIRVVRDADCEPELRAPVEAV